MVFGLPFRGRPWSAAADSLPEGTRAADGRSTPETDGPTEATLGLHLVRAVIEDGLLMVFGPDGDPIPPEVFRAAAAEQPHAGIQLPGAPRVTAERVAAVLEAQTGGRLGSGREGDAWMEAMLGIGPQPETADPEDLEGEDCFVEVVAFGKELLIRSTGGATFLLAEARSRVPEAVCLRLAEGGPIAVGDLVARLLAANRTEQADGAAIRPGEFAAPDCEVWLEDDDLVIDVPSVGEVHLAQSSNDVASGPLANLFLSSGRTATVDDLVRALDEPSAAAPERAVRPIEAAAARSVPLQIDLQDPVAGPDEVALVVVRGLPETARLSAGVASGDGSWLLSPRDVAGLALTPPPGATVDDLSLQIVAIAVAGRDGELKSASRAVVVPLRREAVDAAPTPIPLGIDAQALDAGGRFDAILVLDVPEDATLSAGTYDPAIDAWVLLPRQLENLSVLPSRGHVRNFTLNVLGVSLRSGGQGGPSVLAEVPVTVR